MQPDSAVPKEWWTPTFLSKGETLEELAEVAGINVDGLLAIRAKLMNMLPQVKILIFNVAIVFMIDIMAIHQ